jgi:acetylornithine/N-succinyldiaminopimelate aminotransferase
MSTTPDTTPHPQPPSTLPGHAELAEREAAGLLPTYGPRAAAFVRGDGAYLFDPAGNAYLDFLSGLAVTSLGHAHPAVTAAIAEQAATLVHTSNLFYTEPQIRLAERLRDTLGWPDGKAFFCNSGAEANEAALKLARRHGKRRNDAKVGVVALEGSFHGRTLGALLATGNPAKHAPFEPLGSWVRHVPYDDPDALRRAVDERTCAILLEVVQGEGGVRPVPAAVLAAAREAADAVDALLVIDEVQTGIGRLGAWYGWQTTDVTPDVVCLAKALGNGLPIGAIVAHGPAAEAFGPGDHATTFGGGPVVAAAALAVLDTIEREGLVDRAAARGTALAGRLDELAAAIDVVSGRRGRGLLQAVVLTRPVAGEVTAACLAEGLVVNAVAPDAVRLAPPLLVSEEQLDDAVAVLARVLARFDAAGDAA